jgi:hypothetical protein
LESFVCFNRGFIKIPNKLIVEEIRHKIFNSLSLLFLFLPLSYLRTSRFQPSVDGLCQQFSDQTFSAVLYQCLLSFRRIGGDNDDEWGVILQAL